MKRTFFISLALSILSTVTGLGNLPVYAADPMTLYVVPAISNTKILPTTSIASTYISSIISMSACPGEYEPASFVVRPAGNMTSLQVTATDLTGAGTISASNIDISVVKCWYQAGEPVEFWRGWTTLLTPELLLKDDSLVKVEGGQNYLKLTSGQYLWISDPTAAADWDRPRTVQEIPVQDSATLQPASITGGTNKQFWVTVKVPDGTTPGNYTGKIRLTTPAGLQGEIQLNLRVLPITLSDSYLTYSLSYMGRLSSSDPQGTISSTLKSEQQLRKELQDLYNHGVTNPTMEMGYYQPDTLFRKYLTIRNEIGMGSQPLYFAGLWPSGYQPIDQVRQVIALAKSYGVTEVYFYGQDEAYGQALLDQRTSWQAIINAGGKMFVAGTKVGSFTNDPDSQGNFGLVGDLLDLMVCYGPPDAQEAARWHSIGHQIFCYSNPQVGVEKPETYRVNFGLLLWQKDYDGAMDYAYQKHYGNIWNDFDYARMRDHVFAYPTLNGVIGTIQWEGWREAVDDVRYLTTLIDTITAAKAAGKNTSAAEAWLASLKSADLATKNMDTVRADMVNYILALQGTQPANQPPVLSAIGAKTVTAGQLLQFIVSATDPEGSTLTYSASNLPSGASFNTATRTFSWTPTTSQAGTYANVTFQVSDGSLSDAEAISITVNQTQPANQPPVLSAIGAKTVTAGQLLQFIVSATDPEGSTLTYSASNLPSGASFNTATRTFSWTPTTSQAGTYANVTFQVSDGSLSDAEAISITVNSAPYTASKALSLDGTNDRVTTGSSASLNVTGPFTVDLWIYPQKLGAYQYILDRRADGASNNFFVALWNNNKIRFTSFGLSTDTLYSAKTFTSADLNKWWHVACVYTGSQMQIYVNGQLNASASTSGSVSAAAASLSIGTNWGSAFPYQGRIDEVRISNKARTSSEISYAYNSGSGRNLAVDANTLALWHMDEGTGSIILDEKGASNGTISGAAWVEGIGISLHLNGDINADDKVNESDLLLVQQLFGATGTPGWIKEDVNNDGIVSILDSIIIGQNWTG